MVYCAVAVAAAADVVVVAGAAEVADAAETDGSGVQLLADPTSAACCCGPNQVSSVLCNSAVAVAGGVVPRITCCDVSFSWLLNEGVPRDRIWAATRMVESQRSRHDIMVLATGSLSSKK